MPQHLTPIWTKLQSAKATSEEELLKIADKKTLEEICGHLTRAFAAYDDEKTGVDEK